MTAFKERILSHWREFRPTIVRDLERSGELDKVVTSLEQTVLEKQAEVIKRGMSREQADEVVRPMWMTSDEDACPPRSGHTAPFAPPDDPGPPHDPAAVFSPPALLAAC